MDSTATTPRANWARNVTFAGPLHQPTSLPELQALLASPAPLRVLGTGHSFSTVAVEAPGGAQVGVARMPVVRELDTDRRLVRVSAGLRYGDVTPWLDARGWALHNLGSLPHISVGGACATGTHGSGDGLGVLATAVRAMRLVVPGGDVVELSAEGSGPGCGDDFAGAVVSLGSLGVVTELTLAVEPAYEIVQTVFDDLPFDALTEHFDDVMSAAYSVSLFHDWGGDLVSSVWLKERVDPGTTWEPRSDVFGARRCTTPQNPVRGQPAEHVTEQGVPGPWNTRLPHFRLEFTPSAGDELQSEYLVPRPHAVGALTSLRQIERDIAAALIVTEVRSIAADDLWLSGAYGTEAIAIHFTWRPDPPAVLPLLPRIEERLLPLGGRPHWGKVFDAGPDVVGLRYPRLDDARRLAARFDPAGVLANDFVDTYLR
ncbi:MAG: FAD-binding protein [Acidimicrobiales bacterium]